MNPKRYMKKHSLVVYAALLLLPLAGLQAQICQNPTDTIYGLSTTGVIYPINVNNATIGASLDSLTDGNAPINSNGIGFSKLNGRFYYFERSSAGAAFFQRFVYYDPATGTVLGRKAPPFPNTNKARSGCMNTAGNGYYTIDPAASAGPMLYYFNALLNTWDTVTTVFKDPSNVDISFNFSGLNSGDMAFDGAGNLWILCSSTSKFGLYKINAPVPSTKVASVTAIQVVAPTTATPTSGKSITGLAFNAAGTVYLSTGSGDNKLYRMVPGPDTLKYVGTLPKDDVASDLTSCSYPMVVLASAYVGFDAVLKKEVELSWTCEESTDITGYRVEYSTDGGHWRTLASLAKNNFYNGISAAYHYTDGQYTAGNNFYRIAQVSADGKATFSIVKAINTITDRKIYIGPNPASDRLYVYNYNNSNNKYLAQVFDQAGKLLYYTILEQAKQSINIAWLPKGSYVLKLTSSSNQSVSSHHFLKW